MLQNKSAFLFSVVSASSEPPVENAEFLDSLYRYGVWLRLISANKHREVLAQEDVSQLQKYSSAVAFYQTLGMQFEDIVANLVAWPAWAKDRSARLADLHKRIMLVTGSAGNQTRPYHETVVDELVNGNKSVRINAGDYLRALSTLPAESILQWLGLPWKREPSVKLVPRTDRDVWHNLAPCTSDLMSFLGPEGSPFLTASYNKLKHGPQMVVANLGDVVAKRQVESDVIAAMFPQGNYIRILFDGSRTQEVEADMTDNKRVAPFLLHDSDAINGQFYEKMLPAAVWMHQISYWLLRTVLRITPEYDFDPAIKSILNEENKRFRWNSILNGITTK